MAAFHIRMISIVGLSHGRMYDSNTGGNLMHSFGGTKKKLPSAKWRNLGGTAGDSLYLGTK